MPQATGPLYHVHFRRRREGRTDYRKRLALLKSGKPRLVVRKTGRFVIAQVITYDPKGDRVVSSATSKALQAFGFPGKCNTPSAYLTGLLVGKKAKASGVIDFVLDIGLHAPTRGSLLFACGKGAKDAGLVSGMDESILPAADRLTGKHLKLDSPFLQAKEKILKEA
ncbi:MAG TPA: 50S ribosomal protein L18 [Candidatus Norongarragalinales archaeon]|nr:50S ribosomal protein L18 [Candidatus Norongarragalinales archaeon]